MLTRASSSKAKFTCKKIAYLENLRFRRDEAIKETTRRKRLGRILFLPEVSEKLSQLSHEAVQGILNQGSLFHIYKTVNNADTEFVEADLNLKKLDSNSLVTLLTGQCYKAPQNRKILYQLLETANARLDAFSLVELAQVAYCLLKVPSDISDAIGHVLLAGILERVKRLRLGANLQYSTSLAKFAFVLAKSQFAHDELLREIISLFPIGVAKTYDNYKEEIHFLTRVLMLTGIENSNFVFQACDYYAEILQDSIDIASNYIQTLSRIGSIFMLQGEDMQLVNLKQVLMLTSCLKLFGYNHKLLLSKLMEYIDLATVNVCLHPQIFKKLTTESLYDIGTNYILNVDAFRQYLVNLNPRKDDSAFLYALYRRYNIYCPEAAESDSIEAPILKGDETKAHSRPKNAAEIEIACYDYFKQPKQKTFDKVRDAMLKMAQALPRVIWWSSVPLILKVIYMHKDIESLPLVRSYLEEAYLKECDAVDILREALDIFNVIKCMHGNENLLMLDSFIRIIELCMEPLNRVTSVNLDAYVYLICMYVKIPDLASFDSEDFRLYFEKLEASIVNYTTIESAKKDIPQNGLSRHVAKMYLDAYTCTNVDYSTDCNDMEMLNAHVNGRIRNLMSSHNTLIRHVLYQSLLALQSHQSIDGHINGD